jgi:hypothetical protein
MTKTARWLVGLPILIVILRGPTYFFSSIGFDEDSASSWPMTSCTATYPIPDVFDK